MSQPLLIELGCEELPASALAGQVGMLAEGLKRQLDAADLLDEGQLERFATPRRLAVRFPAVRARQPERVLKRKGPAEKAAFDADGKPTRAAEGFARSVGLTVDRLGRLENHQGRWLYAEVEQPGEALDALLQGMLEKVVRDMAGARSMRWSDRDERFLRPVRWLVALHGETVVPCTLFGLNTGDRTRGHRIHAPGWHRVPSAGAYEAVLESAFVLADPVRRRARIVEQVEACADEAGLVTRNDSALVDEVAGLVEWPVAVLGSFADEFLEVPPEALISSMREHQKSFPLFDADGRLAAQFISVANLDSTDPALMVHGFERVIRPRLADARFFYQQDRQQPLIARFARLGEMLFQEKLGSLADKCARLEALAAELAPLFDADPEICARAARLCKCDLLTEMVGEFPELQGTMGRYYAAADGEPDAVAQAIESHYLPRQAGAALPADPAGRALAVADRLDTLVGVFAAGKKPTGGKDPFALRRAALATVRILEAAAVEAPPAELLARAADALGAQLAVGDDVLDALGAFIDERLRSMLAERGIEANTLHAVAAAPPGSVVDFSARAEAVQRFADDPQVASLITANKRAANLLEQAGDSGLDTVDRERLEDPAEAALFKALVGAEDAVGAALAARDYPAALTRLAELRPVVDRFFDKVMVMTDEAARRRNRLALLARLRQLFVSVADVARLGRA